MKLLFLFWVFGVVRAFFFLKKNIFMKYVYKVRKKIHTELKLLSPVLLPFFLFCLLFLFQMLCLH